MKILGIFEFKTRKEKAREYDDVVNRLCLLSDYLNDLADQRLELDRRVFEIENEINTLDERAKNLKNKRR